MRRSIGAVIVGLSLFASGSTTVADGFDLHHGDVVAFVGGGDLVRMQMEGRLETALTLRWRDAAPKFRDLAREGDTVYFQATERERWREEAFGDLETQLDRVNATVVMVQFGQMESFDGLEKLDEFTDAYGELIDALKLDDRRVVVLSPSPLQWEEARPRAALPEYSRACQSVAASHGVPFIAGDDNKPVEAFIRELTGSPEPTGVLAETVRLTVEEKHRLWLEYWRPANWKCIFGDDRKRMFSVSSFGLPSIQEEWSIYPKLIQQAETAIQNGTAWKPPLPPLLHGVGDANIDDELAAFEVLEGFEVSLFADESQGIANPLSIRWDASGRMYVACSDVYPQVEPGVRGYDKIHVLRDLDNDGVADESRVFAEGLLIPTGMEVGPDVVYVGQHRELLALRDTDGDGVADQRRVLLSGFGNGDSHQTINSFVWSPGGELLMCQGDGIESRVETPFGISSLFQAGVYRLRPGELRLDGLLDDFMGPGNPWGVAFDDFGQSILIDGAGGVSHLTPASIPAKRRLKLPEIGKPGGYCGIECLGAGTLPAEMQGQFVIGDYKKNQVSRFAIVPDGAGFDVEWKEPLLRSMHRNFRPIDVKTGPDGAIYVVDWYNPITCHQDDFYRHPDRDKTHGRIWRIAPKSGTLTPPQLADANVKELVGQLASKERWTRLKAKQTLSLRDREEVRDELKLWGATVSGRDAELHQVEALSALEWIDSPDVGLLKRVLGSSDHRARAYAARVAGRWHQQLPDAHSLLMRAAEDPHPLVRMEAVLASAEMPDPRSIFVVAKAAELPRDRWFDYAFSQAVQYLKPQWMPAFRAGELEFTSLQHGLAAVISAANEKGLISDVRRWLGSSDLSDEAWRTLALTMISIGGDEDLRLVLDRGDYDETLLRGLKQSKRPDFDVRPFVGSALEASELESQIAATELAAAWRVRELYPRIREIALGNDQPLAARSAALRGMGSLGGAEALTDLERLLSGQDELAMASVAAMLDIDVATAAKNGARLLASNSDGEAVGGVYMEFAAREGALALLARGLSEMVPTSSQSERLRQSWVATGLVESNMTRTLDELSGRSAPGIRFGEEVVRDLVAAGRNGNRSRGEALFHSAQVGCFACHKVGDAGGTMGPDLSAVGSGLQPDRIVTEVLWPRRQVKEGYSLAQVTLENGSVLQGYEQANRDERTLLLRDFSSGEIHEIQTREIKEKQNIGSLMPESAQVLSRNEIADLFAFLFGLSGRTQ